MAALCAWTRTSVARMREQAAYDEGLHLLLAAYDEGLRCAL